MIRFRSKAGADVLMLQAHAERLLEALGRERASEGIVLPEQIEAALAAFEKDLKQEAVPAEPALEVEGVEEDVPDLARRAWPVLELLRRARQLQVPVLWSSL